MKVHSLSVSVLQTQSRYYECAGPTWPGWANLGSGKTKTRSLAGSEEGVYPSTKENCIDTELGINLDTRVVKGVCGLCLHPRH